MRDVEREIPLSFWRVHILHPAEKEPVVGQRVIRELRRHGREASPGTLYPLLSRMEKHGQLNCKIDPHGGSRARNERSLTKKGQQVPALLRSRVEELHRDVSSLRRSRSDEEIVPDKA